MHEVLNVVVEDQCIEQRLLAKWKILKKVRPSDHALKRIVVSPEGRLLLVRTSIVLPSVPEPFPLQGDPKGRAQTFFYVKSIRFVNIFTYKYVNYTCIT